MQATTVADNVGIQFFFHSWAQMARCAFVFTADTLAHQASNKSRPKVNLTNKRCNEEQPQKKTTTTAANRFLAGYARWRLCADRRECFLLHLGKSLYDFHGSWFVCLMNSIVCTCPTERLTTGNSRETGRTENSTLQAESRHRTFLWNTFNLSHWYACDRDWNLCGMQG